MRFRAEQHLRRQLDFQHVRTHGRRHDCGAFMLWYARQAPPPVLQPVNIADAPTPEGARADNAPSFGAARRVSDADPVAPLRENQPLGPARLGVVASRSAIGNAVQRARAKRRLREIFRHHQKCVPAGYDLLLVGRNSLNRLEYRVIEQRFVDACRKLFPSAQA
jgi:ribonuclease P protein component